MSKPKIRVFNLVEVVTTVYRDLFPEWAKGGYEVEVFMSGLDYREGTEADWVTDGVRIVRTPVVPLLPKRLGAVLGFLVAAPIRSLAGGTAHVNLFLTQPPLFFVWGVVLEKLGRGPFKVVLMDMYPEVPIAAGVLSPKSSLVRLLTRLSNLGLRRASAVISIGRHMSELIRQKGVSERNITLIPNWSDESVVRPVPHHENALRRENGWAERFVVLYSGNMGVAHEFDSIMDVAERLADRPDIVFAFVGAGSRQQEIVDAKIARGLQNVEILPFAPFSRLGESLSAADLHFVSLRAGFEGLAVPSKFYGILAAGGACVYQGDSRAEIARVIEEEGVGAVVANGDSPALETAILKAVENPQELHEMGSRARSLAENKYSRESGRSRYGEEIGIGQLADNQ